LFQLYRVEGEFCAKYFGEGFADGHAGFRGFARGGGLTGFGAVEG
jgi:hypothetical protein